MPRVVVMMGLLGAVVIGLTGPAAAQSMDELLVRVLERFTERLIRRQREMYARDVPFLEGVIPTAENLALAFWGRLDECLSERSPGVSSNRGGAIRASFCRSRFSMNSKR